MNISFETFEKYGTTILPGVNNYPVYAHGEVMGYKIHNRISKSIMISSIKHDPSLDRYELDFFGQHLYKEGGNDLIITFSEMDCLKIYQHTGGKVPVVASMFSHLIFKKQVAYHTSFLNSFTNVHLAYFKEDKKDFEKFIEQLPKFKHLVLDPF